MRTLSRSDLPVQTAASVYDLKQVAEDAAKKTRDDNSLTAEQRSEALLAIRTETEKGVSAQSGEKVFNSYKRSGGYWMNNLAPQQTTRRR